MFVRASTPQVIQLTSSQATEEEGKKMETNVIVKNTCNSTAYTSRACSACDCYLAKCCQHLLLTIAGVRAYQSESSRAFRTGVTSCATLDAVRYQTN